MIKEVVLPFDAQSLCLISLPRSDDCMHWLVVREDKQGMKMVRHQEEKQTVPSFAYLIVVSRQYNEAPISGSVRAIPTSLLKLIRI